MKVGTFSRISLSLAITAAVFTACGDEVTNNVTGLQTVADWDSLSKCSEDNAGDMVFVSDSATVYYCDGDDWQTLNGKDGADGKDGKDGANGTDGSDGSDGQNGSDGKSTVDTVVKIDTVRSIDTLILNHVDTVVVYDTTTVLYEPEYDTVTTAFLNQEMLSNNEYEIFVDKRDNKLYRTVTIGSQTWMAQNLDYSDGGVTSYCYNDSLSFCQKYGRLYTWAVAMNLDEMYNTSKATTSTGADSVLRSSAQGLCPTGWHVPSSTEWEELNSYVSAYNTIYYASEGVGKSLKSTSADIVWAEGTATVPTDRYGFSAVPTGRISAGLYTDITNWGLWWATTENSATNVVGRNICYGHDELGVISASKKDYRAIRCLKDSE